MHLIQVFLPKLKNDGQAIPAHLFRELRQELLDRFGGITCYSRAPVEGFWDSEQSRTKRDELIIYEIMCEHLDRTWWHNLRTRLEQQFEQEVILVRSQIVDQL